MEQLNFFIQDDSFEQLKLETKTVKKTKVQLLKDETRLNKKFIKGGIFTVFLTLEEHYVFKFDDDPVFYGLYKSSFKLI